MNKSTKFWDRMSKNYDNPVEPDTETYKAVEISRNYLKQSDVALDYGCATGSITTEIAKYVGEIHAIDSSSKMIEVARSNASERQPENIHFACATIYAESYQTEMFDVILAFNILHLLEDTQQVVQRINDLLKPGGIFISTTACLGEKNAFLGTFLSILSKTGLVPRVNMLSISDLENLIANGNFQIVKTEIMDQSPANYLIVAKKT